MDGRDGDKNKELGMEGQADRQMDEYKYIVYCI